MWVQGAESRGSWEETGRGGRPGSRAPAEGADRVMRGGWQEGSRDRSPCSPPGAWVGGLSRCSDPGGPCCGPRWRLGWCAPRGCGQWPRVEGGATQPPCLHFPAGKTEAKGGIDWNQMRLFCWTLCSRPRPQPGSGLEGPEGRPSPAQLEPLSGPGSPSLLRRDPLPTVLPTPAAVQGLSKQATSQGGPGAGDLGIGRGLPPATPQTPRGGCPPPRPGLGLRPVPSADRPPQAALPRALAPRLTLNLDGLADNCRAEANNRFGLQSACQEGERGAGGRGHRGGEESRREAAGDQPLQGPQERPQQALGGQVAEMHLGMWLSPAASVSPLGAALVRRSTGLLLWGRDTGHVHTSHAHTLHMCTPCAHTMYTHMHT